MKYQMYYEMMEQPEALRRTFASELDNMANISKLAQNVDTIYLMKKKILYLLQLPNLEKLQIL